MTTSEKIALGAAIVALTTSLSTLAFAILNYRREIVNQKIQYANLKQQYFAGLRSWADQLADLLSEAVHFLELDPTRCQNNEFFQKRLALRTAISSYIDRGRWFFPNLHSEEVGLTKERAFRGYRQEVLNSLVAAYKALTDANYVTGENNRAVRERLVEAKRHFVSQVQETLDPAIRDQEFRYITKATAPLSRQ
jgi:hypothetical protein